MRIIETKVWEIEEHPDKDKCYDWIRNNIHDINNHSIYELVQSIKKLSEEIGGTFDYCISTLPDRGEFIEFSDYSHEALCRLSADDLPLTGVCWDHDLITGLRNGDPEKALRALHSDTEYQYSDQGLLELCIGNGYEFTEEGELI